MRITDFLKNDFFSLPRVQSPKEDYMVFLNRILKEYLSELEQVENFDDIGIQIDRIRERQTHLVKHLKSAISEYYAGKPASALSELEFGLTSEIKNFEEILNIREFQTKTDFYRIRIHKLNYPLKPEHFFHIPFNLRGKVKTQRFSIPGFPSLYLGTSSYVCWEELSRPSLSDFQIVRVTNTDILKVIDLSPPKNNNDSYDYYKYLMIWPLVFACSVRVRTPEDYFKPEYIIPQLLLQWVRKNDRIDGVSYQTTHIDYKNSLSKGEFLNVALPVKENKTRGLCSHLESKFLMTESISFQLNEASSAGLVDGGGVESFKNINVQEIELIKNVPTNYAFSIFGRLEEALSKMDAKRIIKQKH